MRTHVVPAAHSLIDCVWRGLGKADARNQGTSNPAPARARIPLFPATLLDKMRRATGGSLVDMEPLLSLQTSIGEAFEVNWATCQQLADLIEIRFIKFNLTSIAYQTKSSPLEGLARPRALP